MRFCYICCGTFNWVDWLNHTTAHLSREERNALARQMRADQEANPKPLPPDEEIFRGFHKGDE